jgi:AN1-type zinc finger protein 1
MKEDHGCDKLIPLGARQGGGAGLNIQAQKEKGFAALEKLRAWGLKKKEATGNALATKQQKAAATNLAAINALKRDAKGDAKVPMEKRVFLHVEASADTTKAKFPTGKFYYSKEWSIGRVLDAAAKALQVQNVNNQGKGEAEKLRVFHVEGGRLLEFSEKVGDSLQTGNTIILLRGVGPPIPDLIQ